MNSYYFFMSYCLAVKLIVAVFCAFALTSLLAGCATQVSVAQATTTPAPTECTAAVKAVNSANSEVGDALDAVASASSDDSLSREAKITKIGDLTLSVASNFDRLAAANTALIPLASKHYGETLAAAIPIIKASSAAATVLSVAAANLSNPSNANIEAFTSAATASSDATHAAVVAEEAAVTIGKNQGIESCNKSAS